MTIHYSRYNLNTYRNTPYFNACVPDDYPITDVMMKCRAFRRLPPALRELSALAKEWFHLHTPPGSYLEQEIKRWYDDDGNELNPDTGMALTDEEIDEQWGKMAPEIEAVEVEDIPYPDGGFPDPETWELPEPEEDATTDDERPTKADLLRDIKSHGREYTAKYYGIPLDGIDSDKKLAQAIIAARG